MVHAELHSRLSSVDDTLLYDQPACMLSRLLNQRACTGHPYIIRLHEVFVTDLYLAIVMEYAGGGDVASALSERLEVQVRGSQIHGHGQPRSSVPDVS